MGRGETIDSTFSSKKLFQKRGEHTKDLIYYGYEGRNLKKTRILLSNPLFIPTEKEPRVRHLRGQGAWTEMPSKQADGLKRKIHKYRAL